METTIGELNQLLLQSHTAIDKTSEGGVWVGVAEYVPELNAAVGYLQNYRNMKIAIAVKPQSPTVHLVIGHGDNINLEKEYPSLACLTVKELTDLCTTHLMNC